MRRRFDSPPSGLAGLPRRFGPCRPMARLGAGGWATVYLAELTKDRPYALAGTRVAVKVLKPDKADDPAQRERFRLEGELGAAIDHPRVVRVHEAGETPAANGALPFLVMEYVDGRTLRQVMDEYGEGVPEALLRGLAAQVAGALAAVHALGAVHRDLKPTNVLITADYQVKLADLGVAWLGDRERDLTRTGHFVGTLDYIAPEQMLGGPLTPTADLYALGVVLYEAAVGALPYPREFALRRLTEPAPAAGRANPQLTPFLEELIARLLARDPEARPASAGELSALLAEGEASAWWLGRAADLRGRHLTHELRRVRARHETAFAGREPQLSGLLARWWQAVAGDGGLVLIEGEAGIGKSRLLDELAARCETAGPVHALVSRHDPGGVRRSPGPLLEALARHLGEAGLERLLAHYLGAGARLAPALAAFLRGLPPPPGDALAREAVPALMVRLLQALAAERPVLWRVEDLHFADADARALLAELARAAAGLPALIVATSRPRPEDAGPILDPDVAAAVETLSLPRLSPAEGAALLDAALAGDRATPYARDLVRRSGGNPFFLLELARDLKARRERGEVTLDLGPADRRPAETASLPRSLPASVRDLLAARLAGLDPADRALLDAAAVQGFAFDPELLARARGEPQLGVLERLARLERGTGVVRATGAGFAFDHHLLQELLYERLPPALRREHHARLAAVADERAQAAGEPAAPPAGERAAFLATHFLRGGRPGRARPHLLPALDHLARRYETGALVDLADLALEEDGGDPALAAEVHLRRAEAFALTGRAAEEREAALAARAAAERAGDPALAARARIAEGRTLLDSGSGAFAVLEDGLARARGCGDRGAEARAVGLLGHAAVRAGRFEAALGHYLRQAELAAAIGDAAAEAEAGYYVGEALLGVPRYAEARDQLRSSVARFRALGLVHGEARATADLAYAHFLLGAFVEARAQYEAALALCREVGFAEGEAVVRVNAALLAVTEGRHEQAEEHLATHARLAAELRSPFHAAYDDLVRGDLERARDRPEDAERLYRRALASFRELAADFGVAEAGLALGRLLVERGAAAEATPALREVRRLTEERGLRTSAPLPALYLALAGDGEVEVPARVPEHLQATLRAEAHALLARLGGGDGHRRQAEDLLAGLSAHLGPAERERFRRAHPGARLLDAAG